MEKCILELDQVSITLPDLKQHLKVDQFYANSGDLVTLFGPIGSGKTTLLKVLCGFWPKWRGSIKVDSLDIRNYKLHRLPVTISWQELRLFEHMTVEKNVAYPLEVSGVPKAQAMERTRDVLKELQLDQFANNFPLDISGGQKQLVAIARTIITETKVMLFDEPYRSLDPITAIVVHELIRQKVRDKNLCAIVVTHSINHVRWLGQKLGIITEKYDTKKHLRQYNSLDELLSKPEDIYIIEKLGVVNRIKNNFFVACGDMTLNVKKSTDEMMPCNIFGFEQTGFGIKVSLKPKGHDDRFWFVMVKNREKLYEGQQVWISWPQDCVVSTIFEGR